MAGSTPQTVSYTCGVCHNDVGPFKIDDVERTIIVHQRVQCKTCSDKMIISIKGGKIVDFKPVAQKESDVDSYLDVPGDVKDVMKEAYSCMNSQASKAGACMVRLLLDALLFHMNFQDERPTAKVNSLESKCNSDKNYKSSNDPICRRVGIFKTIAGLAGFHAHAHKKLVDVSPTEFELYLYAVETSVKEHWPVKQ